MKTSSKTSTEDIVPKLPVFTSGSRTTSTSSVNSTTSTIVQTDNLNIEETTSKELLISIREIINGYTISISKEGRTIFRAHLNKYLAAIANKLVDAIERNQNISNFTVKETADSSSNRTVDVREIGIQCNENSLSPDPSAPSKNAPTNDTGAETIKSYLEAAKQGHKEQKALIVVPNDSEEGSNKDIEAILRKELTPKRWQIKLSSSGKHKKER
ncbi:hypothetical protein AVEN_179341-1 [Araneus ventricosus]|uniref:Uncharacterized protein n=1 Tax=Araneus ventricosus TaxID=182803 RepID=A0A4Y2GZB4_ARAVE|nr:hypothetical protein AVEN_179341-1 [Araneus ventricosus]